MTEDDYADSLCSEYDIPFGISDGEAREAGRIRAEREELIAELRLCRGERDAARAELAKMRGPRCDECGDKIYSGPPDCPMCGAPNCCPTCCREAGVVAERDAARAELAKMQSEIRDLIKESEGVAGISRTAASGGDATRR